MQTMIFMFTYSSHHSSGTESQMMENLLSMYLKNVEMIASLSDLQKWDIAVEAGTQEGIQQNT